jgi:hypothetical protein
VCDVKTSKRGSLDAIHAVVPLMKKKRNKRKKMKRRRRRRRRG